MTRTTSVHYGLIEDTLSHTLSDPTWLIEFLHWYEKINEIIFHCRLVTQRPCSSSTCQYPIWCSAVSICHWQRRSSTNELGCWVTRFAFCSRSCATDFWLFPSSPCWPSRSTATSWSDTPGSTQSEFHLIKYNNRSDEKLHHLSRTRPS